MKVTEAVGLFVAARREGGLTSTTSRMDRYSLTRFVEFLKQERTESLEDVTPALVESYKAALLRRRSVSTGGRLKASTLMSALESVRRLFVYATERGWTAASPAERIMWGVPSKYDALPNFLTMEEMAKVLAVPDAATPIGARDRAILELMYASGMRNGEVSHLELADVDLEAGWMRLRAWERTLAREVPLPGAARESLGRYLKEIRPAWWSVSEASRINRGRLGPIRAKRRETAVFLGPRSGDTMSEINVEDMVREAVQAVKPAVVYAARAIRCACAARLLKEGVSLSGIHTIFGYKNLCPTESCIRAAIAAGIRAQSGLAK